MAIDEAEIARVSAPAVVLPPPKPQKPHWAFTAIGIATILGLCYWGELVLAVMLVSVLLAFILAPVMEFFIRCQLPRGLAAAVAVVLLLSLVARAGVLLFEPGHQFCAGSFQVCADYPAEDYAGPGAGGIVERDRAG